MKKKQKLYCPYCGAEAVLRHASTVYGENTLDESSYLFVCSGYPICDSYVNAHRDSKRPMGTLANSELRNKRILAHHALAKLWQSGRMTKSQAYWWLQIKLGLDEKHTHIGYFNNSMCDRVIKVCNEFYKTINASA